ncbi:hypothetical protein WDZ17_07290 [Pseudokineococcus basanitobsidens]|uniref:Uncharacterized protein n=1 Tax=Pseudokineococcus basanitobsidens TaxID=1926649 RepID=A0ABU8RJ25_9ACTN
MGEQGARRPGAAGERRRGVGTQAARRQLMRSVTAEIPESPARADRAARREALLHALEMSREMSRRRRGSGSRP